MSLNPNPSSYYRLTNHYTGPSAPLSVYRDRATGYIYLTTRTATNTPTWSTANNEPTRTPYWQIIPAHGSDPPRYHIYTEYHDDDETESSKGSVFLALDVFNQNKSKPHLTKPGNYTGQFWSVKAWPRTDCGSEKKEGGEDERGYDGTMSDVMLTNDYSGEGMHLDTYSDTKQGFLGEGDHTGQHWVLERVEKRARMGSRGETEGRGMEIAGKISPAASPRRIIDQGVTVGMFSFGIGFGAAVVVAVAWIELLPLLLIVGLSLGGGVWLGLMSPRKSLKIDELKQLGWGKKYS